MRPFSIADELEGSTGSRPLAPHASGARGGWRLVSAAAIVVLAAAEAAGDPEHATLFIDRDHRMLAQRLARAAPARVARRLHIAIIVEPSSAGHHASRRVDDQVSG
jgi:hypothetical protein